MPAERVTALTLGSANPFTVARNRGTSVVATERTVGRLDAREKSARIELYLSANLTLVPARVRGQPSGTSNE